MRFPVLLRDGEDGWIVAECPAIRGCVSQGKTPQEALTNIADAISGCLAVLREIAEEDAAKTHTRLYEVEVAA
jgi:predicted RNase H-like HicB family nuclease